MNLIFEDGYLLNRRTVLSGRRLTGVSDTLAVSIMSEDEGSMFLRNVGIYLQVCMAS
jgi:hypothetical protein